MATPNEKILVRYEGDISQIFSQLDMLANKHRELESTNAELLASYKKLSQEYEALLKKLNNPGSGGGVGGATKQFNALNNSVMQLSRELPAFAVNVNTGFLAISNNIPALMDALKKIRAENAALAAEGKRGESVFKQLGAAIFSWQSLISIGVTLLTVYGGKLFDVITGAKDLEEQQKRLAKATDLANKSFEIEERRLRALGVSELVLIERRRERIKQNIILAKQELETQRQQIAKITAEQIRAQSTGGPAGNLILRMFAPSEEEVADAVNKRKEIELKIQELDTQLAELDKKKTDEIEKQEKERTRIAERERKERERAEKAAFQARIRENQTQIKFRDSQADLARQQELDKNKQHFAALDEAEKEFYQESWQNAVADDLAKRKLRQQQIEASIFYAEAISSVLGSLAQAAGQQTAAGKGLAIADTLISTYASAQKAYASQLTLLTPDAPIRAKIAATLAVASGLARVAAIAAIDTPTPNINTQINTGGRSGFQSSASTYPRFKDGVVDLQGPGTETSDSIPAYLSKGESVIKAKSTRLAKDELSALNRSYQDYEQLLNKKRVNPAVEKERERMGRFAANLVESIAYNFNDTRIVKAIEKNKPATAKDIENLTTALSKQQKRAIFESKLRGK